MKRLRSGWENKVEAVNNELERKDSQIKKLQQTIQDMILEVNNLKSQTKIDLEQLYSRMAIQDKDVTHSKVNFCK